MIEPLIIRPADPADRPNLRTAIIELQENQRLRHPTRLPGEQTADAYPDRCEPGRRRRAGGGACRQLPRFRRRLDRADQQSR